MVVRIDSKHPKQPLQVAVSYIPVFFLISFVLALTGCGKKSVETPSSSSGTQSTADTVVDPATTGSISGTVYLDGPAPVLPSINMQSEPACVKANPSGAPAQAIVAGKNGALANVVVYAKDGLGHYRFAVPKVPVVLDQKGCTYQPRVAALMTNQPLEIRNSDTTIHNVHAMPKVNGEWNKAQRAGGAPLQTSFPSPEMAIPFMCNVHPWMRAFVFVFDHPYFAVTRGDGKFELTNLPPGTYTIEAWQEKLGTVSQKVTIGPHESSQISFRFKSELPSR